MPAVGLHDAAIGPVFVTASAVDAGRQEHAEGAAAHSGRRARCGHRPGGRTAAGEGLGYRVSRPAPDPQQVRSAMRKIVLSMSVSLDGFFEGPNREIDWHLISDELHRHLNERIGTLGGFLTGRVSHELMAEYWPTADQDPDAPEPVRAFAEIWRTMPKIVYSRTLDKADWNATVVREVAPDVIRALKEQPGGDLAVGGAELAAEFRRHDLIDEYLIYVHPVLLGHGRPLFRDTDALAHLRLVESRGFDNGVVLLHYTRDGADRAAQTRAESA
ncbi:dihydrofolate reductase family protein [Streptomyces sp. NPDC047070]|uniref:dihydrofolate reductase family protein n=1 Tax=Streptomyces sp. NPDC047070 TaxID=3154923 RepID=UPI00345421A2